MAGITSGRITERHVAPKESGVRSIVKRESIDGRKVLDLAAGEGITIGRDIFVMRVDNGSHVRIVVQAPLSVVVGRVEAMVLS